MTPHEAQPMDDACYLAVKAKDARFDGCFFTGVTSTGIYCRPVCRVRTPKRENCRFFAHASVRWPDAFPAGDVALHKALGVQDSRNPAKEALAASHAWQPWRSYAVIRAWASMPVVTRTRQAITTATK